MARVLHLAKLCVGIRDAAHLREVQATRLAAGTPLHHRTRNFPRRAVEILDGGSLYWVISGSMLLRQRIVDIVADRWEDGSACACLCLASELVALEGRPTRPFQGWRYLEPAAAPPDLAVAEAAGSEALPEAMRRELQMLGLL